MKFCLIFFIFQKKQQQLFFIVFFALILEREIPTWYGALACIAVVAGVILVSYDADASNRLELVPILIHVGSDVCGGLQVALMRGAWRRVCKAYVRQGNETKLLRRNKGKHVDLNENEVLINDDVDASEAQSLILMKQKYFRLHC